MLFLTALLLAIFVLSSPRGLVAVATGATLDIVETGAFLWWSKRRKAGRGGTGAAALAGIVVSAGGEEPGGTIAEVLAYRVAERRWVRLADLPTPRHGVGVAALGGRVFVIGGGPEPGLTVSSANEALRVTG